MNKALLVGIPAMVLLYFLVRSGKSLAELRIGVEQLVALGLFFGIGLWLRTRPHREAGHSVTLALITTLCVYCFALGNVWIWYSAGYFSHLVIDYFNTKGEQLLWPAPGKWCLGVCSASGTGNKVLRVIALGVSGLLLVKGVLL